eukprot:CAMPEP_0175124818 /NCGR_PEP_ID=MMETSP0087-20121206/2984_1 /TAXON_ID=136419 /ORGANISM="Unknown Unknown, Strain D1" /LENGTH=364 /DNA_ID=CAMNT_0016406611 /DNA_START=308 /DNA_END=1402 /DNA_ORIENTATION=+
MSLRRSPRLKAKAEAKVLSQENRDSSLQAGEVPKHRRYKLGWWPEFGALDRWDKYVSMPIFRAELGGVFEHFMAVPGVWFGMPPSAWLVLPCYVAYFAVKLHSPEASQTATNESWLRFVAIPITCAWGAYYFVKLRQDKLHHAYLATKQLILPSAFAPSLAFALLGEVGSHAVSLTICCWIAAVQVTAMIKKTARRTRPVVALKPQLEHTKRIFPAMRTVLSHAHTAWESFPSGDVAGAMVFTHLLHLYGCGTWCVLLVVLSAFGRLYFHAHHLLDVAAGSLLSMASTTFVVHVYGLLPAETAMGSAHTCSFMLLFALYHILGPRFFKPLEVPEEYRRTMASSLRTIDDKASKPGGNVSVHVGP